MPSSDAHKKANRKYEQANVKSIRLALNKKTDLDILTWLEKQESKMGSIKAAIREKISREK